MKKLSAILVCTVMLNTAFGQTKVPVDSVKHYVGEKVTVCSEVFGVKSFDNRTYINVGAKYPNAPLTIVIFKKNIDANFPDSPEKLYGNQFICVTGVVTEYKGKAEIVISKPEEIVVDNK